VVEIRTVSPEGIESRKRRLVDFGGEHPVEPTALEILRNSPVIAHARRIVRIPSRRLVSRRIQVQPLVEQAPTPMVVDKTAQTPNLAPRPLGSAVANNHVEVAGAHIWADFDPAAAMPHNHRVLPESPVTVALRSRQERRAAMAKTGTIPTGTIPEERVTVSPTKYIELPCIHPDGSAAEPIRWPIATSSAVEARPTVASPIETSAVEVDSGAVLRARSAELRARSAELRLLVEKLHQGSYFSRASTPEEDGTNDSEDEFPEVPTPARNVESGLLSTETPDIKTESDIDVDREASTPARMVESGSSVDNTPDVNTESPLPWNAGSIPACIGDSALLVHMPSEVATINEIVDEAPAEASDIPAETTTLTPPISLSEIDMEAVSPGAPAPDSTDITMTTADTVSPLGGARGLLHRLRQRRAARFIAPNPYLKLRKSLPYYETTPKREYRQRVENLRVRTLTPEQRKTVHFAEKLVNSKRFFRESVIGEWAPSSPWSTTRAESSDGDLTNRLDDLEGMAWSTPPATRPPAYLYEDEELSSSPFEENPASPEVYTSALQVDEDSIELSSPPLMPRVVIRPPSPRLPDYEDHIFDSPGAIQTTPNRLAPGFKVPDTPSSDLQSSSPFISSPGSPPPPPPISPMDLCRTTLAVPTDTMNGPSTPTGCRAVMRMKEIWSGSVRKIIFTNSPTPEASPSNIGTVQEAVDTSIEMTEAPPLSPEQAADAESKKPETNSTGKGCAVSDKEIEHLSNEQFATVSISAQSSGEDPDDEDTSHRLANGHYGEKPIRKPFVPLGTRLDIPLGNLSAKFKSSRFQRLSRPVETEELVSKSSDDEITRPGTAAAPLHSDSDSDGEDPWLSAFVTAEHTPKKELQQEAGESKAPNEDLWLSDYVTAPNTPTEDPQPIERKSEASTTGSESPPEARIEQAEPRRPIIRFSRPRPPAPSSNEANAQTTEGPKRTIRLSRPRPQPRPSILDKFPEVTQPVSLTADLAKLQMSKPRKRYLVSKRRDEREAAEAKKAAEEAEAARILQEELAAREAEEQAKREAEEARRAEEEAAKLAAAGRRQPREKLVKPLSAEWEAKIEEITKKGDRTPLTTNPKGIELYKKDLMTVLGRTTWLNDEVINTYLEWIVEYSNDKAGRNSRNIVPKAIGFNSFFYSMLSTKGHKGVDRWAARKHAGGKKLLEVDTVLIPVNNAMHWTMIVISPTKRTVEYLDSFNGNPSVFIEHTKEFLRGELKDAFIEDEWSVLQTQSTRQTNGYDCGVFTITNAECVVGGITTDSYDGDDMAPQRRRIAAVLLNRGFGGELVPAEDL
jgi:hypothetical protein